MITVRLSKHTQIVGEQGIEKIRATRVVLVGVSGNGSPFALFSALVGFTKLSLIDPDRLEESNRNRFLFGGREDVGRYKVDVAKDHLDRVDAEMECQALPIRAESEQGRRALRTAEVVVSAVDNNATRVLLQRHCARVRKPLLDLGSGGLVQEGAVRLLGSRTSLYVPGGACLFHQTLDETDPALSPVSFLPPNVVAAAVGLEMLLSWLTGYGEKFNLSLYDSLQHSLISMKVEGDPNCPYCSGQLGPQLGEIGADDA